MGKSMTASVSSPVFSVLHSKTIVFDDDISWIGSFNLDPRSAYFNTENVAVFESRDFAQKLRGMIIGDTVTSWHVTLQDGQPRWTGWRTGASAPKHTSAALIPLSSDVFGNHCAGWYRKSLYRWNNKTRTGKKSA